MPRRALRCCVELSIHAVSAPGVWLPSKEDVYISISLLGQYKVSRLLSSVFPLLIHEKFNFQKTFYTALDPAEVADYLEDELVVIELLQLSEYSDGAVRLASYSACCRDFLFPYPSLAPTYSSTDRELLLTRSVAFPGISPKFEFSTKTVIKESLSPELDSLEDALETERGRRTTRRSFSPVRRPRSASLGRRVTDLGLCDSPLDSRPPFVVRKMDTDLIGRNPGGHDAHGKSRFRKTKGLSSSRDDLDVDVLRRRYSFDKELTYKSKYEDEGKDLTYTSKYEDEDEGKDQTYKPKYEDESKDQTYKLKYEDESKDRTYKPKYEDESKDRTYKPKYEDESKDQTYKPKYEDEDAEVSELTSRVSTSYRPRPRSASPVLTRPSFRARYGLSPPTYYYPSYYSSYADYLSKKLDDYRLARLTEPIYPYYPYYSTYRRYLYDPLYDLDLSTRIATRRYLY